MMYFAVGVPLLLGDLVLRGCFCLSLQGMRLIVLGWAYCCGCVVCLFPVLFG